MSKKGKPLFLVLVLSFLILLCICCFSSFILFIGLFSQDSSNDITETKIIEGESRDEIALIEIQGLIASTQNPLSDGSSDMVDQIINKLEKARKDDNVKAIIISLDTPGGTVYDSAKISSKVREVNQEKPVIAQIESSATSGGYYISANASKIVASETSLTGSIGVVVQIIKLDGLYEKLGIEVLQITNEQADVKTLEHVDDPESKDRAVLDSVLEDHYESFINTIITGRSMKEEDVKALADGSIFSGKKALELGLVDYIGDIDTAITLAEDEAGIENASIIRYDTYIDPLSSLSFLIFEKINPLSKIDSKLNTDPGQYVFYLPE